MKYIKYVEKNTQLVNPQLDSVSLIWSEEKGKTSFYKKYAPAKADASSVANMLADTAALKTQDVEISDAEAVVKLTDKNAVFNSVKIANTDISSSVFLRSAEKVTVENVTINGSKDAGNGKINFYAPALEITDVTIGNQATVYNVFEGSQETNATTYNTQYVMASGVKVLDYSLTHNVINVYTPANNAVITVKDSDFNLNVDTSNVLRVSNYMNSDNVTIVFDNIHWTYENAAKEGSDWNWAGLVIFQPAGADLALKAEADGGTLEHIKTWTIKVKDCYYNGKKVTASNFGQHSALGYCYNLNGTKSVKDIAEYMNVVFE